MYNNFSMLTEWSSVNVLHMLHHLWGLGWRNLTAGGNHTAGESLRSVFMHVAGDWSYVVESMVPNLNWCCQPERLQVITPGGRTSYIVTHGSKTNVPREPGGCSTAFST